ncbi:hypothetical protein [uncultured Thermosynechococcus sp.]|uniref:hypothetical protein n=1 Tax=uncultured Thermosynechococcus sp. TaxID=436945 RepID=UPI0026332FEB|nr:hypothetical protein [uncultured Thermosynechococcus sp.]
MPLLPTLQHPDCPEIYGVGMSVQLQPLQATPVPTGLPKTGQMTEEMASRPATILPLPLGN